MTQTIALKKPEMVESIIDVVDFGKLIIGNVGTLQVHVRGNRIPRSVFGHAYIVCAILRQLALTFWLLYWKHDSYDILFIDQLSACVPLFKWLSTAQVMFYCHFPDKLLAKHDSTLKRLYRAPIDKLEEWTTGAADTVVVNSGFTAGVFKRSFPSIFKTPRVLYPPINLDAYDRVVDMSDPTVQLLESPKKKIISINRFERKKNVELALRGFAELKRAKMVPDEIFESYQLILAGGYDKRLRENVEYLEELDALATSTFGLKTFTIHPSSLDVPPADAQVIFLCSFNDAQRTFLLDQAELMLYTPSNEHFGITPVEGMYASVPVIATNSGGPLESVKDKETGLLLPPEPEQWAQGIHDFMTGKYDGVAIGRRGREHVQVKFSLDAFSAQLEDILDELMSGGRPTHHRFDNVEYGTRILVAVILCYAWYYYMFA
ncbi:Alpha-1,3-mannosyltransferase-like protein [Apophysomyces sp. BC1034]|nr:Alpha-1,3-mannosyltransferase-like protein [Apophysomyces sp. BC1015]KAG0182393.1 Alpha-1,3-mannosyltransferase-like protein [Apophysomyces sp. BC1021]KAG0192851.1 Alpha-1,3-mannosyltransferase-like protein [Apophysomyces sp. BC1034]